LTKRKERTFSQKVQPRSRRQVVDRVQEHCFDLRSVGIHLHQPGHTQGPVSSGPGNSASRSGNLFKTNAMNVDRPTVTMERWIKQLTQKLPTASDGTQF